MAGKEAMSRRDFVGGAVLLAGAATAQTTPEAAAPRSRVVTVRHGGATVKEEVQAEPVAQMADRAVMALSGEATPEKAWARYFSADERVGIKINGRGGVGVAVCNPLIKVCVERLQGIGVKPANIIIWDSLPGDLRNSGLSLDGAWGAQVVPAEVGWDEEIQQGSFKGRLTTIVTQRVDAILNLPFLKDHILTGVTLALKNHYGSISNPEAHHDNGCDPFIADLNTVPALRGKQRLILCDGTRSQPEGGPQFRPGYRLFTNLLMAATDPVAHDWVGWRFIEARRKDMGLPPLARVGRPTTFIRTAAQRGLGTDQPDRIEQVDITLA